MWCCTNGIHTWDGAGTPVALLRSKCTKQGPWEDVLLELNIAISPFILLYAILLFNDMILRSNTHKIFWVEPVKPVFPSENPPEASLVDLAT